MSSHPDAALRAVLKFDNGDLADNRDGQLSIEQDISIQKKQRKEAKRDAIWLPILAIPVIFQWQSLTSIYRSPSSDCVTFLVFLVTVGGFLYWLWHIVDVWQRYSHDLSDGCVEYVEGLVVQNPKQWGRYTGFSIQVAGQEFNVEGNVMLAFRNGGQYRVYYTPHSRTIVAAESPNQAVSSP